MSSINNSINISAFFSTESSVSLYEYDEDLELLELEAEREQFSLLFEECLLAQSIDIQVQEGKPISQKQESIRSFKLKSKLRKLKQQTRKNRIQTNKSMMFKKNYCVDSQDGEWQHGGQRVEDEEIKEQPTIPQPEYPQNQEMLQTNIQNCNNCQISELVNALDIPLSSKLSLQI